MELSLQAPHALLEAAVDHLGYGDAADQSLLPASQSVQAFSESTWVDKGEWLSLASSVGAEELFFVGNNPVVVFAKSGTADERALRELYHRVWCMSRPRLLFLEKPGELAVYDLAVRPPDASKSFASLKPLAVVQSISDVAEKLKVFHREAIETGRVFKAEARFGRTLNNRADKALIRDLKAVRKQLVDEGLCNDRLKYAHALIGRSIFIRYLEDRGVLTEAYFREVAQDDLCWTQLLDTPVGTGLCLEEGQREPVYPRVLQSQKFTYALFRKLAEDFNGDMFPGVDAESRVVKQRHLDVIRHLTYGNVGPQRKLFFFAYRFDVIPIELISSIYEEFYHEQGTQGRAHGAFYTPSALVEFLLSKVLKPSQLERIPRILDPACGSGIFLVEAFRRIVRFRVARQKRRLRFDELQKILRDQLAGIDVNPEAVRVAAFSLYLAMLHYLKPSDIREQVKRGNRLPYLVVDEERSPRAEESNSAHLNCLISANAFDSERLTTGDALAGSFSSECADIVVGNPPWGSPGTGKENAEAREQNRIALEWCDRHQFPVGDRERSQTFIWRALDFLKPGGIASLLVSTGVFLKHHRKSVAFRRKWLRLCALDSVINFAHARHVFFGSAIAPFGAAVFRKPNCSKTSRVVEYWSAKRTKAVESLQSVILSACDRRVIRPDDDLSDHKLWKTLWWGNHCDRRLVSHLLSLPKLSSYTGKDNKGQGYKKASRSKRAEWLADFKSLPADSFRRYGPISWHVLSAVPPKVECRGKRSIYSGLRLLVGRGIDEKCRPKGQVVARLERRSFAFTHAINGVKLPQCDAREYSVILGVLWSSLARYFLFLTSADWGGWHDAIQLDGELLTLPIMLPRNRRLARRIERIVNTLRRHVLRDERQGNLHDVPIAMGSKQCLKLERELDAAIFELYGLGEEETDLVRDMCDTGLDFLYRRDESDAVKPICPWDSRLKSGTIASIPESPFGMYLHVFTEGWSAYLDKGVEMHWEAHISPDRGSMLAVVFSLHNQGESHNADFDDENAWSQVLAQLDEALMHKVSSRIYVDGLARAVTDDFIIVTKRNERRLWTKSMAREDVEATLVQAMHRNMVLTRGTD